MIEYRFARPEEEADILDFINLVFSQNARPHDFEKLLPKVYAHPGFSQYHAVAVENGRIKGTVAMLPLEIRVKGTETPLRAGYIGSVSVHPKARGEGHMIALMQMQIEEARRRDYDFLSLGGQRQRYGYFGFEKCGVGVRFHVNASNVRHALKDASNDDYSFVPVNEPNSSALNAIARLHESKPLSCVRSRELLGDILHTFNGEPYLILGNICGEPCGYLVAMDGDITELALADGAEDVRAVIKCWMEGRKKSAVYISGYDQDMIRALQAFSESYTLSDSQMIRVFHWQRVLDAGLRLAVQTGKSLPEGEITVEIENAGCYTLANRKGEASVRQDTGAEPVCRMTQQQAAHGFFSSLSALYPPESALKGWMPLPLDIPVTDQF